MDFGKMLGFKIGNLEIKLPIVQGGMGVGISMSKLASAVANAGGIGVIASTGIGLLETVVTGNFKVANSRVLRQEINKVKSLTKGIIGINLMVAISDFTELLKISVEEEADIVFLGAGLPLKVPDILLPTKNKNVKTKSAPIVSSARAANIIFKSWKKNYNHVPDAVVVEGPLAGGHLGFKNEHIDDPNYSLENLVPAVVEILKPFEKEFNKSIPVIAAGGVYTGKDIHKFLGLGAQAVQMATKFVATVECDASDNFKQEYVNCKKEDIVIIKSPVGLLGRAINNDYLKEVSQGKKIPFKCPWKCLKTCDYKKSPYCIALALTNAKKGEMNNGFAFCGSNAYRNNKIVTVEELISELVKEYNEIAI